MDFLDFVNAIAGKVHPLGRTLQQHQSLIRKQTHMKYIKLIIELIHELALGLTQSGRIEILPEEKNNETI